jgi:Protein of unknown function (DUF4239)
MNDWLHDLPILWMAAIVFGVTYIVTAAIYAAVMGFTKGEWGRTFKGSSPGMLPPLGILFGLFVAFTAAQAWSQNERAAAAVDREASALKGVLVYAAALPPAQQTRLRDLIAGYIAKAVEVEWPHMSERIATLEINPQKLSDALELILSETPANQSQETAQREILGNLNAALDARRTRILISREQVNLVKWSALLIQAVCALVTIALVHSDNPRAGGLMMTVFATGIATSVLLVLAHDRPFAGQLRVGPEPLLQVVPAAGAAVAPPQDEPKPAEAPS